MEKTNILVSLSIFAYHKQLPFEEITKELGLKPSMLYNFNEKIVRTNRMRDFSRWLYEIDYYETFHLDEQLEKLFDVFKEKTEILKKLKDTYEMNYEISICINILNGEPPSICIDEKYINFMSDINASMDIDMYVISSDS